MWEEITDLPLTFKAIPTKEERKVMVDFAIDRCLYPCAGYWQLKLGYGVA